MTSLQKLDDLLRKYRSGVYTLGELFPLLVRITPEKDAQRLLAGSPIVSGDPASVSLVDVWLGGPTPFSGEDDNIRPVVLSLSPVFDVRLKRKLLANAPHQRGRE